MLLSKQELHLRKIIHRDLKPDNIMSHNGVYKIVDFGFSKQMMGEDDIRQTCLGTITTMAPEVANKEPYGLKVQCSAFRLTSGLLESLSTHSLLGSHPSKLPTLRLPTARFA